MTSPVKINTTACHRAYDIGRVTHRGVLLDINITFTLFSAYGYVGGHGGPAQARRISNPIHAIDAEKNSKGGGPAIIAIDLNAEPGDIPRISERLIGKDYWIDVAGRASLWCGTDGEPPCDAPGAKSSTRRDYIFAHPALIRYISRVNTFHDGTFATHARVEVTFKFNGKKFLHGQQPI